MSRRRKVACLAFILLVAAFGPALAGGITFMPVGPLDAFFSGISNEGTNVFGSVWYGPNFYWTRDGVTLLLGGSRPAARTVRLGDGRTIVGCATDEDGLWNVARWLGGESWETLGTVPARLPGLQQPCHRRLRRGIDRRRAHLLERAPQRPDSGRAERFRYLDVYLRSDKVPGIDGWSFETIAAITRDGKALIGNGVDPEGRLQGSVVYFDAPFH